MPIIEAPWLIDSEPPAPPSTPSPGRGAPPRPRPLPGWGGAPPIIPGWAAPYTPPAPSPRPGRVGGPIAGAGVPAPAPVSGQTRAEKEAEVQRAARVVRQPAPSPRVEYVEAGAGYPPMPDFWVPGHKFPYMAEHPIYNPPMMHNPYTGEWKPMPTEGGAAVAAPAAPAAGGGGGGAAPAGEVPEVAPRFGWWGPSGVTPYLRPWAAYLRELLAGPAGMEMIQTPFPGAGEEEAYVGAPTVPGLGMNYMDVIERLKATLELGEGFGGMGIADQWQTIIDKISGLGGKDIEAVQLLSQLRYDAGKGWYLEDIPLIQHPSYT